METYRQLIPSECSAVQLVIQINCTDCDHIYNE